MRKLISPKLCRSGKLRYDGFMKIAVFGSRGYLGGQFLSIYPDALAPRVDIADARSVGEILEKEHPDVVINTAGKTGRPNVDWCEDHKEETIHSNVTGPLVLLEECMKRNIYMVHLSSGCIYDGDKGGEGYAETDAPNFFGSFYSKSKIWSDQVLADFPVLILRIRMPFDDTPNERSLITKILKYERVLDVRNSLTYIPELLQAARLLIEKRKTGIYHVVNPRPVSPYEIIDWYKEIVDPSHRAERLTLEQLPQVAKTGRSNCVLSPKKVEAEGMVFSPGDEAVKKALRAIAAGR